MDRALQRQQNHQGVNDEFHGLDTFHRNKPPTLKGMYDLEGAQEWLREIEKIFHMMTSTEVQKVQFGAHMLSVIAEDG